MRRISLAFCVLAAACSGGVLDSPTSPMSVSAASSRGKSGVQLPFRGTFTTASTGLPAPPVLEFDGTGSGTATRLGRFTVVVRETVSLITATSTGTMNFTAANGDRLFTTTTGAEDAFVPPNESHTTVIATIVGGTGRFASATGSFTVRRVGTIDFATATSTEVGSFEGEIGMEE